MKNKFLHAIPLGSLVLLLIILGVFWHQSRSISQVYLEQVRHDLAIRTELLLPYCREALLSGSPENLRLRFRDNGRDIDTRITIIDDAGKVVADTDEAPDRMDNHQDRPEIAESLHAFAAGKRFHTTLRYSTTLGRRMLYCSVPLRVADRQYVVRTALSLEKIDNVMTQARRDLLAAVGLTVLAAAVFSYLIVILVTRPVGKLRVAAGRIASGNLDSRLPVPARGAIRDLALALNEMAEQLKSRIAQISREKSERDAIFSSLSEGVVMLDMAGEIIDINAAACRIFELASPHPQGTLAGLVRHRAFEEFIRSVRNDLFHPDETELTLSLPSGERHLRVRATRLSWNSGEISGLLLVIYDQTQVRVLENYRRDFVANVSHEIKTPLTVIRGAVETLQDGALEDPEAARHFLQILSVHAERLNALVQDILALSELERRSAGPERDFERIAATDPAASAVELLRARAAACGMELDFRDRSGGAEVLADRQMLEQAVMNLIVNAIRYSESEAPVEIEVSAADRQVQIRVMDHGCGIAAEHLPRLFERFYRVDKARSRKAGGTGLGLAIVKHIMQLHGGSVEVQSTPGLGSTFTLLLPQA